MSYIPLTAEQLQAQNDSLRAQLAACLAEKEKNRKEMLGWKMLAQSVRNGRAARKKGVQS